jgi:nucleotide-binding universal stress UspA family protein
MITKILLPTDGSESAEKAMHYAIELAKLTQAEILVLHAYQPVPILRKRGTIALEEYKQSLLEEATEIATDTAEPIKAAGIKVEILLVEGQAAEAILQAAEQEAADLVVMGSRGSGGLPGLRLGSVVDRVVRHAAAAVLVVK